MIQPIHDLATSDPTAPFSTTFLNVLRTRRIWVTAVVSSVCVIALRLAGLLQSSELAAFDQTLRLRPTRPPDPRIVIIEINDDDIRQFQSWPFSDDLLAQLLHKIKSYQPRVIGLDIYRELPVGDGSETLQALFRHTPNLIGIEKLPDAHSPAIQPHEILMQADQVGFNNVVADPDGRVRRAVLFWTIDDGPRTSFSLRVATKYLEADGTTPQPANVNPMILQMGQGVFHPLKPNHGGYARVDNGGYQIVANPRGNNQAFRIVSASDIFYNRLSENFMRDRIVLIGSTAISLKDFFYTSYSGGLTQDARPIAGVELHAHFISQILTAASDGQGLIHGFPELIEWLWVGLWAWMGAALCWRVRSPLWSAIGGIGLGSSLIGCVYGAVLLNWWIPIVPPALALLGAGVMMTGHLAHLKEELKKSKEFLHSVINTIPDPIYVKNTQHQWIVLNEAYCRFVGYPLEKLLDQSEQDFFQAEQASMFRHEDEAIFVTGIEHEREDEFTNANGITYSIATKRSLHRDAAGNLFLVGIIRDVTQRKRVEDALRQTAEELGRSNAELRQAEGHLRHIAYHDALTGLPNRKLLFDQLNQSIEWASQNEQIIAVLFLDLDRFKQINDSEGHLMGDLLLKAVGQRLIGCLRSSDTVARLGGDEFIVILPGIPTVQHVDRVAQKILNTLAQSFVLNGKTLLITSSIGISIYPQDGQNSDDLITSADQAMYLAKKRGKSCYAFSQTHHLPYANG